MKNSLFIIFAFLLSACSSMNYVGIETYNPAEITFPKKARKLLIVNNAIAQPKDKGYEFTIQGEKQADSFILTDSALFDACRSLGNSISEVPFFDEVLLYNIPVRKEKNVYMDVKLTPSQVDSLCDETGTDAIVSLDRLLFDMKKEVVDLGVYVVGEIDVKMNGIVRSYVRGRETSLATVSLNDSTLWTESAENSSVLNKILPTPEEALRASGEYFGFKIHTNFVPHWQKETRWYFLGMGSRWKEATAFAEKERWKDAEVRWMGIYKSSKKWSSRSKTAANLALCCEMRGDLEKALEWAQKSYDLFKENKKKEYSDLMELYVKALTERIQLDNKLNIQFGKE